VGISKGGERLKQTSGMKWEEQKPWVGTSVCHLHFRATVSFFLFFFFRATVSSSLRGVNNIPFAGLAISSE